MINDNKHTENNGSNTRTAENGSIPGFLGNAGKSKEVSRVFAAILRRGYDTRNESQRTIQNHWMDLIEPLAKEYGAWIDNLSSIATIEIGHGHENTVFRSIDGNNVIKFNNLKYIYDEKSIIQFIERINSHNEFSQNAPYTILGFTNNPEGGVGLVMSQPYIKMAMEADSYAIGNYLIGKGFKNEYLQCGQRRGWTNGIFEFNDAVPRNVLMDVKGNLYFIDLQINNPTRLKRYLEDFEKYKKQ